MKRFLILFAIAFAVFCPSITGTYTYWDDTTHIINNPWLVDGEWWKFWTKEYYRLYIPVIYTVWTLIFQISKEGWIYHVFNYALHAVNALLFFRLAQLSLPRAGHLVLMLAAAAFIVHPLQTEPVAWIAGGRDLLSTFFAFAAALVLWQAKDWKLALAATILFVLSLLSKATTAPLPVALVLIPEFRKTVDRARAALLAVWLAVAAVVIYINKMVQQQDTDNLLPHLSIGERLLTVIDSFGFYIQKILVPYPLSGDYGRIPRLVLDREMYWLPLILLAATCAVLAFVKYRRRDFPTYGLGFFVLMMAPVSGIVSFMAQSQSSVADRYVYMAWAGPCILLAFILAEWPRVQKPFMVVLVAWSAMSFARARIWVDNIYFFPNMLEYNPESFVGHTTMGVVDFQRGRLDLAEQHFKDAHKALPMSVSPVGNLAQVFVEQARTKDILEIIQPIFDTPGFIAFNATNKPSLARCARVIARALYNVGRYGESHQKFCQALVITPEDAEIRSDFAKFATEMQRRGITLPPCQAMP